MTRVKDAFHDDLGADEQYRIIVDHASDAIFTIDDKGVILSANPAVLRVFGYLPEELIGHKLGILLPPDLADRHSATLPVPSLRDSEPAISRTPGVRRDGTQILLEVSFSSVRRGARLFFVGIARDITAESEAGRRLAESEERFRDFFQNGPIGFHSLDGEGVFTSINRAELRMIGHEYSQVVGKMKWTDLVIPDQRERAEKHWHILEVKGEVRDIDYTLRQRGGRSVYVRLSATARRDGRGRIESTRGTVIDVTVQREAEEALRGLNQQYKLLFDRSLAGIYRGTLDGRIVDCNDAYARTLGYDSREDLLSTAPLDPSLDREQRRQVYGRLRRDRCVTNNEVVARQRDGTPIWLIENATLIEDGPGGHPFIEGTVIDVTARKIAEERVAWQALHDGLTGLANPALFEEKVSEAIAESRESGRGAAVLFVDLDHFKAVNDTRGHDVGNQILQIVAWRLQRILRHEDTVSRLGGDEFTLVTTSLRSREDAQLIARKILDAVATPYLLEGSEISITASVGVALYPEDGEDCSTLMRRADEAMYAAKESGKNAMAFASEGAVPPCFDDGPVDPGEGGQSRLPSGRWW